MEKTTLVLLLIVLLLSIYPLSFMLFLFKDYHLDKYRFKIFYLRTKLFKYAEDKNIDFTHPAYGMVRTMLNGYINQAETLDLLTFTFVSAKRKKLNVQSKFLTEFEKSIKSLSEEQVNFLLSILNDASYCTAGFMFNKAPFIRITFIMVDHIALALKITSSKLVFPSSKTGLSAEVDRDLSDAVYKEGLSVNC